MNILPKFARPSKRFRQDVSQIQHPTIPRRGLLASLAIGVGWQRVAAAEAPAPPTVQTLTCLVFGGKTVIQVAPPGVDFPEVADARPGGAPPMEMKGGFMFRMVPVWDDHETPEDRVRAIEFHRRKVQRRLDAVGAEGLL